MSELSFISSLLIILFSLSGAGAGILLFYLAPEEVLKGKKYFVLLYRALFVLISGLIFYFLYVDSLVLAAGSIILSVLLLILDSKKGPCFFVPHYLFFQSGYFFSGQYFLVAAMIFLFGLPAGTLLWMKIH